MCIILSSFVAFLNILGNSGFEFIDQIRQKIDSFGERENTLRSEYES